MRLTDIHILYSIFFFSVSVFFFFFFVLVQKRIESRVVLT